MIESAWPVSALHAVTWFQEGPGILAKDFSSTGVPLIRLAGLGGYEVDLKGCNFIDPLLVERRWSHFRLKIGDILISTSASFGRPAVVNEKAADALFYTGIIRFRSNDKNLDENYLKIFLGSEIFMKQAEALASGSVIKHFGPSHLREMFLPIPPIFVQEAVASIIGFLEGKIEANRQMNETLEAMARAIFKDWFVEFGPTCAKMKGRPPYLPPDLWALFPDRLDDEGKPEGWVTAPLSTLVHLVRDSTNPALRGDEIFEHFSLPAFDAGQKPVSQPGNSILSIKTVVPQGAVLLSKLNPEIPRVWLTDVETDKIAIASTEFLALSPKTVNNRAFIYCCAVEDGFRKRMEAMVSGTSKSHQRVSPGAVLDMTVAAPPKEIMERFAETANPLLERVLHNRRETGTLAATRDLLLPRLMSGELRIRDAEKIVQDAA